MDTGISDSTLKNIKEILHKYLPADVHMFIYGSRATQSYRTFSDVDIGIESPQPISPAIIDSLHEAFEESDIPYIVTVTDFSKTSQKFQSVAKQHIISL